MKKNAIATLCLLGVTILIINSCQKTSNRDNYSEKVDNGNEAILGSKTSALLADCVCQPGQSLCEKSCTLSSCCICCTGDCAAGCYFGIASCQCEKKEPDPNRTAFKIKKDNLEKVIGFIETNLSKNTDEFRKMFSDLDSKTSARIANVPYNSQGVTGTILKFTTKEFTPFFTFYKDFISKLSFDEQKKLQLFIDSI